MMLPAAVLLLVLQLTSAAAQAGGRPPASRPTTCGNVSVPYPFGIRDGCSLPLPGFNLTCDQTRQHPPRLLLGDGSTLQVVEISLANSTVRAMDTAGAVKITYQGGPEGNGTWSGLGSGSGDTYVLSEERNQFAVTGCNVQGTLLGDSRNVIIGCSSSCSIKDIWINPVVSTSGGDGTVACSGVGCCQTPIPIGRPNYTVEFKYLDLEYMGKLPMALRIAERGWFDGVAAQMLNESATDAQVQQVPVPVVLDWVVASTPVAPPGSTAAEDTGNWSCPVDAARSACRSSHSTCHNVTGNPGSAPRMDIDECALPGKCFGVCTNRDGGYECRCPRGARGSPYMADGCVKTSLGLSVGLGVGSGAGLLVLALGSAFVARGIKNRRARMLKQKFFKQNRGHMLQQLVFQNKDIAERMTIPLVELEKATNNFNNARKLGGGGHGTVYKGILSDLHVVAIKKSKVAIQREIDEFINEVAILSQVNHRNVVRLFGCCLETEVPLLVYEFISNGTLYDHLHVEGPTSLRWDHRLRIATETARALAYLHMVVSFPIVYRDVKSHNILLEGSLTAKVSDFGASRCISPDQTGVTTAIQGTLGYLDPMYYYTGRLTEKSDVYSFGVVLIELLTRKKPFSYRSPENDGLIAQLTSLLTHGWVL
ncbi:unnamed protein product [Miscanthus lutarioriparius]|uniref:Protein kinase domain-containing protein n=1 Tax=Miscanthus lutarioriparius TaxID=422564 RepID=A0A811PBT9_9POAL|nr:unnamed protein product [Miscanthus lutarioriparius]